MSIAGIESINPSTRWDAPAARVKLHARQRAMQTAAWKETCNGTATRHGCSMPCSMPCNAQHDLQARAQQRRGRQPTKRSTRNRPTYTSVRSGATNATAHAQPQHQQQRHGRSSARTAAGISSGASHAAPCGTAAPLGHVRASGRRRGAARVLAGVPFTVGGSSTSIARCLSW